MISERKNAKNGKNAEECVSNNCLFEILFGTN
jgi:hypothetical protein